MAAPTINFAGFVYDDAGDAVSGATIHIYDKNSTSTAREASSITTNSSGYYSYSHATPGEFDVEIVKGTSKRRYKFDDKIHLSEIDVEKLSIRGNEGAIAGLYLYADEGDDASDQWLIDAGIDGVLGIGNDIASQGTFVDQVTVTPNATVTDGTVAVKGNLTVGNALTVTGTTTLNGNLVLGDAAADTLTVGATLQGASPLTFEGGTSDGYETTFAITDPTADRTITFPNLSGTVQLSGNPISGTTGTFTGTITGGTDGSGVDVVLYSGTAGDNLTWDASEEVLIITGTNGATSLNVADGNVTIADDLAVDGTSNLDNTDIDGTLAVDGTTISLDATTSLNIDNSNTSNGITIGTATSGVPISIGHSTSETTINDNLTVTGTLTGTLATAAQANVTSLGTLTTLTVDNVIVNGTTIGHTSDTDLLTLTSGNLTIAGTTTLGGHLLTGGDRSIYGSSATSAGGGARLRMLPNSSSTPFIFYTQDNDDDADVIRLKLPGGAATTGTVAWENINAMTIDQAATIQTTTGALTIDGDDGIVLNTGGSGGVQVNEELTVGVDDTGYDVKFFGATSGKYMLWDESEDTLQVEGKFTAIGGSEVSNALIDTHADFVFNDSEARIQIVAEDTLSNAASIILTNVVGSNDNNNWVIAHKGPSASNDFRIGYRESTSAEDVVANMSNRLAITTAGDVTLYGNLDLVDSDKIRLGTSQDLEIYHDANNSIIHENGTGNLLIGTSGGEVRITSGVGSEFLARFIKDDGVYLYDDDSSLKFNTSTTGATITGTLVMVGTTPSIVIGDGGAEDTMLRFDGNAQDYHMGLDDSGDVLTMGKGSTLGTTTAFTIGSTPSVGFFRDAGANNLISIRPGTTLTAANAEASMIYSEQGTVNWDNASGGDATIAIQSAVALRTQAWAGASNTLTFTEAATLWIEGAPTDSDANVTITNPYALWVGSGASKFAGNLTIDADGGWVYMKGGATSTNATGIAWTFNTADTRYSEIQMDYDTRASTGFLIHSGYPITIDATTEISHLISGTRYAKQTATGFTTYTDMYIAGTTPRIVIGDAGTEDTAVVFDGNVKDYYMALDDSGDTLLIGEGSTVGTTPRLRIQPSGYHYFGMSTVGAYTSSGDSSVAVGFAFETAITAVAGDTTYQSHVLMGANGSGSITTQNNSETIPIISTLMVSEPDITKGNDTVSYASSIYIGSVPTEGGYNYSLFASTGTARFNDGISLGNADSTNNKVDDSSTGSGSATMYIGNQSITTSSDMRLKTDIVPTNTKALELVDKFNVVDFGWDDPTDEAEYDKNYRGRYMGMLAQDTVKVAPWVINDQGGGRDCTECMAGLECDSHGMFTVEYQHLVPTLIKAVQELRQELQEVRNGNR